MVCIYKIVFYFLGVHQIGLKGDVDLGQVEADPNHMKLDMHFNGYKIILQ